MWPLLFLTAFRDYFLQCTDWPHPLQREILNTEWYRQKGNLCFFTGIWWKIYRILDFMGLLKIPAKPSMKFCVKAEGWKNAKCTRCGFLVVGVGRLVLIFLISRHYENKKVWLHNGYFGYLQRCRGCGVEWGSFMWGRLLWEITRVHPVLHFSTHMPQIGGV